MIVYMEKRANRIAVEHIASVLRARGLKVFLKNGDGTFTLAVFQSEEDHADYFSTEGLYGIKRTEYGNKLFVEKRQEFVSAEEYFRE